MVNQGWLVEFAPAINNPIWYICVLLWLYLLYYFIEYTFKIIGGKKEAKILLYCSIALIGGGGWHFSINLPFLYLSDCRGYATFFFGIVIYHLLNRVSVEKSLLRNISLLSMVVALFIVGASRNFNWYLWVYIICPAVLVCGVTFPQIHSSKTEALSEITFQLYLWHVPCFYVFQFWLDIHKIDFMHSVSTMFVVVLCCFAFSVLVYQCIDLPISNILRKGKT